METYLGLDLGGTKLLIGEIDSRGNILKYKNMTPDILISKQRWILSNYHWTIISKPSGGMIRNLWRWELD